jgi:hypothetical protein
MEHTPEQLALDAAPAAPARLTTREKRERKADRLREWAGARDAKQPALNEAARADEEATGIPFGQPILVGHHSERRHRNAIDRIDRNMRAAADNSRKAATMSSRADNIDAANDAAIYDDDPDALDRLRAKLARLEARREHIKTTNAAYRKTHSAELKAETNSYLRDRMMPFPAYELRNLGGVITTTRQRIERLSRPERGRRLEARYPGECRGCGAAIDAGDQAVYYRRTRELECEGCAS